MVLETAVVGLGVVSDTHLEGIVANPRTRLAAVCDLDSERAQTVGMNFDIPYYTDVDELIGSGDLDWAHICTPVQTHVTLARKFIEADIPVLIEKPIAETSADVDELIRLSEKHGIAVSSVQNHIFDPVMRKLTRKLESGEIGQLLGVDTIYVGETMPDEANRGSWVFDLPGGEFEEGLAHPIYLTLKAGGWPRSKGDVRAQTALVNEYTHDFTYDNAQIQYVTENDVLCSLKLLAGTTPQRRLYAHGIDGTLMADFVSQTVIPVERDYTASGLSRIRYTLDQSIANARGLLDNGRLVIERQINGDWGSMIAANSHFYQFDAEAIALENNSKMPVPLQQSWWTIAVLEALRTAS